MTSSCLCPEFKASISSQLGGVSSLVYMTEKGQLFSLPLLTVLTSPPFLPPSVSISAAVIHPLMLNPESLDSWLSFPGLSSAITIYFYSHSTSVHLCISSFTSVLEWVKAAFCLDDYSSLISSLHDSYISMICYSRLSKRSQERTHTHCFLREIAGKSPQHIPSYVLTLDQGRIENGLFILRSHVLHGVLLLEIKE